MFRELPRAGTPLRWVDLLAIGSALGAARPSFEETFCRWLPARKARAVSSGRAALYLILRDLSSRSSRREVVIPAYTCPTVPISIAKAGLRVRLCDVGADTGNMDAGRLSEVISDRTLCVVPVHMSGVPCDIAPIVNLAARHGAFVVEDCAQAAGATIDGRKVGTFGEFSFFSLGRGKGFTAYEGGVLVANRDLDVDAMTNGTSAIRPPGALAEGSVIVKFLTMAILFHPRVYWSVRSLPLGWENELYDRDFPLEDMGRLRKAIAATMLARMDFLLGGRRSIASQLAARLSVLDNVKVPLVPPRAAPSYPWLAILLARPEQREEAYERLRRAGLGPSRLFTRALDDYQYLRDIVPPSNCPNARHFAARILTLPTHGYVTPADIESIAQLVGNVADA